MRLIDTKGMTPAQIDHHTRVYAGHCLMHDVVSAWMINHDANYTGNSALLKWAWTMTACSSGRFGGNRDVVQRTGKDVEVSGVDAPRPDPAVPVQTTTRPQPPKATVDVDLAKDGRRAARGRRGHGPRRGCRPGGG